MTHWWHSELNRLELIGLALAFMYGIGVAAWEYCTFLRADYFTWAGAARGFIWPWLWLKTKQKRQARQEFPDNDNEQETR
jgi:hypothetical protein